jgi:superfamily I DNA/RNA helicase/mRNA-degrading endonuclease RelE of RelBE toxin-antitoxin system
MRKTREINIKPSCMSEIHAFPADQATQLWEKINYLVADPLPDGKLKKKIRGQRDLYRLRVGDHRVFYTFGDTWVRLLGIRRRDERTYEDNVRGMMPDRPTAPTATAEDDLDDLLEQEPRPREFRFDPKPLVTPLPRPLTPDWLKALGISASWFPVLVPCRSEEELLAVALPSAVLERVLDNLFPRPIEEVAHQPDLVVQDTEDLVRYKEGDLLTFLLKLDEDQRELTRWALQGPTMVKGGAGTGKSTVALYRVKALLEHPGASGQERLLFATYTRALIAASRQLLGQLLSAEQMGRVRVATCDEIAREIVAGVPGRRLGPVASGEELLEVLRSVRASASPSGPSAFDRRLRSAALARLTDRYLLDEFEWIVDGRGLSSQEEYREAPRPGRGHVLRGGVRDAVWEVYQAFVREIGRRGRERFAALRLEALQRLQSGEHADRFDFVVVDEAQDLSPVTLGLMAELSQSAAGLFFAADNKQSLYSRNYTWSAAHPRLQFTGRTAVLKRNYRSTAEIDRAAFAVLTPEEGEALETSASVHTGPMPVLLRGAQAADEGEWAGRFVRQMCRHLRMKISASAVLVPTEAAGRRLAEQLSGAGVAARFFPGRELDLEADVVKVLTLHSAKGLEFPIVVVCGFDPGTYPVAEEFDDPAVYQERLRHERRLLYVGMSRAMRGLMVAVQADCRHEALLGLPPEHWHVEEVS